MSGLEEVAYCGDCLNERPGRNRCWAGWVQSAMVDVPCNTYSRRIERGEHLERKP